MLTSRHPPKNAAPQTQHRLMPKSPKKDAHAKTYDSQDSLMVTHLTTSWPVTSLDRAERTGRLVLWYL